MIQVAAAVESGVADEEKVAGHIKSFLIVYIMPVI
jgi:hypothetical protein